MEPSAWQSLRSELLCEERAWLVSGAAGFIGSHLVETLLELGQRVVGLDNLSTGLRRNLEQVSAAVGAEAWRRFRFVEGDLSDVELCRELCASGPLVLHQAGLGSVPRSLAHPRASFESNVHGFFGLMDAARRGGSPAFVYASSSSVYGDDPRLPRRESSLGAPLSPYAATKRIDELLAQTFQRCYAQPNVGLRYFNVFGPRQDPAGAYAAVIPRWAQDLLAGERPEMHGDGSTSRDFCPVSCVVQANLLAAWRAEACQGRVYNVAMGASLSLAQLFERLRTLAGGGPELLPRRGPERAGDVRHSLADLSAIQRDLGYAPEEGLDLALERCLDWYRGAGARTGPSRSAGSPRAP